jgi:hypothetical protein
VLAVLKRLAEEGWTIQKAGHWGTLHCLCEPVCTRITVAGTPPGLRRTRDARHGASRTRGVGARFRRMIRVDRRDLLAFDNTPAGHHPGWQEALGSRAQMAHLARDSDVRSSDT